MFFWQRCNRLSMAVQNSSGCSEDVEFAGRMVKRISRPAVSQRSREKRATREHLEKHDEARRVIHPFYSRSLILLLKRENSYRKIYPTFLVIQSNGQVV